MRASAERCNKCLVSAEGTTQDLLLVRELAAALAGALQDWKGAAAGAAMSFGVGVIKTVITGGVPSPDLMKGVKQGVRASEVKQPH